MNRNFVQALLAERAPCFAMGLVVEGQTHYACLALRPVDDIPKDVTHDGFNFGHSIRGTDDFEVVHFGFEFYGYCIFNALINPSNLITRTILVRMVDTKALFFLAANPARHALGGRLLGRWRSEPAGIAFDYYTEQYAKTAIRHCSPHEFEL